MNDTEKRITIKERIEILVKESGCTYLEAMTHVMNEQGFTPARMAKILDPSLFSKLKTEIHYTKQVQASVLDQYFQDGKLKMNKSEAIECSKKIRSEIEIKESIIKLIEEMHKRSKESDGEVSAQALIYKHKIEDELAVLIELSNLCYLIAGE